MRFLPVKYQIAFGLATIVTTTLMVLITCGIGPDSRQATLDGRKRLCEAIAINSSIHLSQNDLVRIEGALSAMVERDPQLLSAAIRRADGASYVEIGHHNEFWTIDSEFSTDAQVQIPLMSGGQPWGRVELRFQPLSETGLASLISSPWAMLVGLTGLICFALFSIYLKFILKQLDPKNAIPKRVQFALDNIAEGLLVTDRRGRVLLANEAFAGWTGKPPEKLIGSDAVRFPWQPASEDQPLGLFPWLVAMQQQRPEPNFLIALTDHEGNLLTLMAHSSPLLGNDGKYRGVLTSFEDITALEHHKIELSKAKDAADEANQAKSDFLARMSHEIRTPMNAILGYTDVLRRGMVSNESQRMEHLTTIQQSGEHLLALINDILDLSKIEAGKMEIELVPVSPVDVVSQVLSVLKIKAKEKGIKLEAQFATDMPASILTDAVRIKQSLINLIGNAIKFTDEGSVKIVAQLTGGKRRMLCFHVVDTGIGMTPEAMKNIFDPFSQADSSITRRFGGTGLGLSISLQIAEKLGGKLSVVSEVGKGSVFTLTIDPGSLQDVEMIPADSIDTDQWMSFDQTEQTEAETHLEPSRILVVDDGESNRQLVGLYLQRAGVDVVEAVNGLEAVQLAEASHFDVILMDMHMPVMDGFEATRTLREKGYNGEIIALTADVMKDDERKCREAGCSGFLTKPISLNKLMSTLAECLGTLETDSEQSQLAALQSDVDELCSQAQDATAEGENETPITSSLPMDDADFREIVEMFIERLSSQMSKMDEAAERGDTEALRELGHWLKGAGGTVGFDQFTKPAAALENSGEAGDLAQAREDVLPIKQLAARIVIPVA